MLGRSQPHTHIALVCVCVVYLFMSARKGGKKEEEEEEVGRSLVVGLEKRRISSYFFLSFTGLVLITTPSFLFPPEKKRKGEGE